MDKPAHLRFVDLVSYYRSIAADFRKLQAELAPSAAMQRKMVEDYWHFQKMFAPPEYCGLATGRRRDGRGNNIEATTKPCEEPETEARPQTKYAPSAPPAANVKPQARPFDDMTPGELEVTFDTDGLRVKRLGDTGADMLLKWEQLHLRHSSDVVRWLAELARSATNQTHYEGAPRHDTAVSKFNRHFRAMTGIRPGRKHNLLHTSGPALLVRAGSFRLRRSFRRN